jgi:hypothetical protein
MRGKSGFAAGQRWRYRTRPGDEGSSVLVLEVTGRTVHVQVRDVALRTEAGPVLREIFLPIAAAALRASVTSPMEPLEEGAFAAARLAWRTGHDTLDKGEFTIPLDRFLDLVERP